jgi:hypothetical protein
MQILDQDQGSVPLSSHVHQPPHRRQQLALPRLGIGRRWAVRVWHAQKVEQHRQEVLEAVVEQQQSTGDLAAGGARWLSPSSIPK